MLKKKSARIDKTEEMLDGLEFGFHNNRLEGLELPKEEHEKLRAWVRQGLTVEEMIARVRAEYAGKESL